jgi:iron complex transport system permease protein
VRSKTILIFFLLGLVILLISPWIGPEPLELSEIGTFLKGSSNPSGYIFWHQRIPRVLLAFLAGGTLAVIGAAFQVLFRNPLVEPFTLGISGGAALGAFLAIAIPRLWMAWGPFSSIQLFALIGAAGSLGLIYSLARKKRGLSVTTLLLAGVTISIICGGSILMLTYFSSPNALMVFQRWMMGGVDIIGYRDFAGLAPLLIPGMFLIFFHMNDLNHMALGEEMAAAHGVPVRRVQRNVFAGGGLATAAVVSLVGPIGFIGLIVPHAARRLAGFDQRTILPCSFFLGGSVLTVCDTLARTLLAPTELPVGIITAVLGGPLFIYLLVSRRWN